MSNTSFGILSKYKDACSELKAFSLPDMKRWANFSMPVEFIRDYEKDGKTKEICEVLQSTFEYEQKRENAIQLPLKENPPLEAYRGEDWSWPRYKATDRPQTNMLKLCTGQGLEKNALYLPVVRYPGAYRTEEKQDLDARQSSSVSSPSDHCGTFYFIEPESSVLLNLGKTAIFGSKFHAFWTLAKEEKPLLVRDLFNQVMAWQFVYENVYGKPWLSYILFSEEEWKTLVHQYVIPYYFSIIRSDKRIPTIEFRRSDAYRSSATSSQKENGKRRMVDAAQEQAYLSTLTPLIPTIPIEGPRPLFGERNFRAGVHDYMDQAICVAGRAAGFDTIVLQHEVGQRDAVSEILDLRSASYTHCHLDTQRGSTAWYVPSCKAPKVWFIEQGFIVNNEAGKTRFFIDEDHLNQVVMY